MIEVAKILKPCGIKGEMKLKPYVNDLQFWKIVKNVEIEGVSYKVLSTRFYKDFLYIFLDGVTSMSQAEMLTNLEVLADENDIPREDGEYLICDLVGCVLQNTDGKTIGTIDSVEKYGSADIINFKSMGALYSFPFLKNVLKSVDIKNKIVVVYKDKLDEVLV